MVQDLERECSLRILKTRRKELGTKEQLGVLAWGCDTRTPTNSPSKDPGGCYDRQMRSPCTLGVSRRFWIVLIGELVRTIGLIKTTMISLCRIAIGWTGIQMMTQIQGQAMGQDVRNLKTISIPHLQTMERQSCMSGYATVSAPQMYTEAVPAAVQARGLIAM